MAVAVQDLVEVSLKQTGTQDQTKLEIQTQKDAVAVAHRAVLNYQLDTTATIVKIITSNAPTATHKDVAIDWRS